jgi:hypothetical protein
MKWKEWRLRATATVERWEPIDTFPKDGTRCDVLCETTDGKNGARVIVSEIVWAREPIGNRYGFFGKTNRLSGYLTPLMWRRSVRNA